MIRRPLTLALVPLVFGAQVEIAAAQVARERAHGADAVAVEALHVEGAIAPKVRQRGGESGVGLRETGVALRERGCGTTGCDQDQAPQT